MIRAIVCRDTDPRPRPKDAIPVTCSACEEPCWTTADQQPILDEAPAVCLQCAGDEIHAAPRLPRLALTAEGARRLKKRQRRYARRHGLRVEDVRVFPPVELVVAAENHLRRN